MSVVERATASPPGHLHAPPAHTSIVQAMGWAIFLGMSWTWCIGMFVPVLFVRDDGLWGWIVFAIPNVIGAAAMGWTITASGSRAISQNHGEMLDCFAIVTAGFQIFFIGWIATILFGRAGWLAVAFLVVAAWLLENQSARRPWLLAGVALGISGGCAIVLTAAMPTFFQLPAVRPDRWASVAALGSSCCLGFALCPYLDPTFHRARQAMDDRAAKFGFGLGFGIVFFSMIVFSLLYAVRVRGIVFAGGMGTSRLIAGGLLAHWLTQTVLTVVYQVQGDQTAGGKLHTRRRAWGAFILAAAGLLCAALVSKNLSDGGEFAYWMFMSTYGLLFPAYVWLCVIPSRGKARPSGRALLVTLIVICVALPFYWLAYIDRRMPYVAIGVGIVLLARLLISSGEKRPLTAA